MSVTDYRLEELLLYEELEKLREQYGDNNNFVVSRRIENVLKICSRYLSRAKKIMRAYT